MSADTTTSPPPAQVDPRRTRGVGGVLIVLRRELATKFLTRSYLVSTLFFALLTLLVRSPWAATTTRRCGSATRRGRRRWLPLSTPQGARPSP